MSPLVLSPNRLDGIPPTGRLHRLSEAGVSNDLSGVAVDRRMPSQEDACDDELARGVVPDCDNGVSVHAGDATPELFTIPEPSLPHIDPTRYSVKQLSFDAVREVMEKAHYIGRPGSTSVALGVYADGMLGGAITFGTIPKNNAAAICGQENASAVLELTRLALYDWMPANSESWLIARSFGWLRENRPDVSVLISYADQSRGHVGTIYQATNWLYTGTSTGDVVYRTEAGVTIHPRTVGFTDLPPGRWMPSPEKHRYVTFLGSRTQRKALRRALRWPVLPYPKTEEASA